MECMKGARWSAISERTETRRDKLLSIDGCACIRGGGKFEMRGASVGWFGGASFDSIYIARGAGLFV